MKPPHKSAGKDPIIKKTPTLEPIRNQNLGILPLAN